MKWYPCMKTCPSLLFLLAWLIPSSFKYATNGISLIGTHNNTIKCISKEREALLQFKQGIEFDDCELLTTWDDQEDGQSDCCQWHGIRCDNLTGHVIRLELRGTGYVDYCLRGNITRSLLELKHLKYLDLSCNRFQQNQPIPSFIGSLVNLQYLNLSFNVFLGEIPHQVANLPALTSLDLNSDPLIFGLRYGLYVRSLDWLSHLNSLRDINLSGVDLSEATDWLQIVNGLPFLRSLHLDRCSLSSKIHSFLSYKNSSATLHVLSLSDNELNNSAVLQWVSNLTQISTDLEYLDLSESRIPGRIPSAFGRNMHFLSYLDLSANELQGPITGFLDLMHSLSYLDLSRNGFQGPIPRTLGDMHSLSHLDLSGNTALEGLVPGSIFELQLLEVLDLSSNSFQGIEFSNSSNKLCNLQKLDLSSNNIINDFSSIIQTFSGCANNSLLSLDLHNNSFWGSIPSTIGRLSSLEMLDLNNNQLNGTVSPSLSKLSMLNYLDLASNSFRVTLSNHHLSNLSSLRVLSLSNNPELVLNISDNWDPHFQLEYIVLRSCNLGPHFPKWIFNQKQFSYLDISHSGISANIPASFWNISTYPRLLNLSHNEIYGVLPNLPMTTYVDVVDLSSNNIEGEIPSFLVNAPTLLLNDNKFSGSITFVCPQNSMGFLSIIDLSNNFLSGKLPDCWDNFPQLAVVRLDNNNFTGNLPPSLWTNSYELKLVSIRNNALSGDLHLSCEKCFSMSFLDLGYNSFTGYIPDGIGNALRPINVLSLRRNNLSGGLPLSLCNLTSLWVLDLSFNHISGTVPECIFHLREMTSSADDISPGVMYGLSAYFNGEYVITEKIMWKGKEQNFNSILGLVRSISISDNDLEGPIPTSISCLTHLASLDLARNNLTGSIPLEIGEMKSLELLDLSSNHLSAQIPSTLTNLNFLDNLNLSYNNLSGMIPTGTQLQRSDPSAYMGNPRLCGPPLPECIGDPESSTMPKGDSITRDKVNDRSDIFPGLYVSMVLGFIVGFWGVCGTLVIKRSWRHAYFRFVEDINDKVHVMVAVTIARVWRRP